MASSSKKQLLLLVSQLQYQYLLLQIMARLIQHYFGIMNSNLLVMVMYMKYTCNGREKIMIANLDLNTDSV